MGYWKNKQIEDEARGFRDNDKLLCIKCVGDYILKSYIESNGDVDLCSYCEQDNKCMCLSEIMPLVMSGISQEYEDANNCVSWDSREGGFVGSTVWDSYEFIDEILAGEMGTDEERIKNDLFDIMNETPWCHRDPYGERPEDELFYTWESFSQEAIEQSEINEKLDIMDKICDSIVEHKLVTEIEADTPIYRSRFHDKIVTIHTAEQLASPKPENTSNNRMSKRGCPMFYGALDKDVCLVEVGEVENFNVSIGIFYNQRKLKVIDFTKLKDVPYVSLFDIDRNNERVSLSFLKKFNDDISKPVDKLDSSQMEYIPTQLLTNYLRDNFKTEDGEVIDGILYNSSILKNRECVVLFLLNEDASDEKDRSLWLDNKSLETYTYNEYVDMKKQIISKDETKSDYVFDYELLNRIIKENNASIDIVR